MPPMRIACSSHLTTFNSVLVSAGKDAGIWAVRGIAIGGVKVPFSPIQEHELEYALVIVFAVSLHGLAPRLGVRFMNASRRLLPRRTKE